MPALLDIRLMFSPLNLAAGRAAIRGWRMIYPGSYAKWHFSSSLPLRPVMKEILEAEVLRIRRSAAFIA